jgi:SWI/SNF-related matrix-associated actin-dependent regulator of chromatin subfamily A member 5
MYSDDEAYVPPQSESESEDELDVMAASSPRVPTDRTRLRRGNRKRQTTITTYGKRKRAKALSAGDNEEGARKRAVKMQKLDDKKAVGFFFMHTATGTDVFFNNKATATVNLRKAAIDAARTRWLNRHRELFEPLLPPSSSFSENLQKEMSASRDKGVYVSLRAVEEQPKLVKGGTMKDYQVSRSRDEQTENSLDYIRSSMVLRI